jgi:tRNA modification GTPase
MRDGFRVVLAGPPNAGKSSLLNALSRSDAAIVSDEAGTTRDLKEIPLDINGQLVILIDSAGLRETSSKAEAIGVGRARDAMRSADLVLWLQAPDVPAEAPPDLQWFSKDYPQGPSLMTIGTKSDLGLTGAHHSVSVATGDGIDALLEGLHEASGASFSNPADLLVSRERDHDALRSATAALADAVAHVSELELAAEDLRRASYALERLLGRMDVESVLDRLFSSFCIGK